MPATFGIAADGPRSDIAAILMRQGIRLEPVKALSMSDAA